MSHIHVWLKIVARFAAMLVNQASRVLGIIALASLLAMMTVTVADVLLRYFFNAPIKGGMELTQYFMVVTGFLGLAWCAVHRGHVTVNLLLSRLPSRVQSVINSITMLLAMSLVPVIVWQTFAQAKWVQLEGIKSMELDIPAFPFYIMVAVGYALLFLVMIILLTESISRVVKK